MTGYPRDAFRDLCGAPVKSVNIKKEKIANDEVYRMIDQAMAKK
jgi:hypothetical protein